MESLVIVDQHATVNLYLSLVHTARHIMGAGFAQRVRCECHSIKDGHALLHGRLKNADTMVSLFSVATR